MCKISIIVPIYNRENIIDNCIQGILSSRFSDFELILIDDGSKDNSLEKCFEYSKIDKRVKVFSKDNGGVSSARNYGLTKATGEWILFVDSDDTIYDSCLDILDRAITHSDLDIDFIMFESKVGEIVNGKVHDYKSKTINNVIFESKDKTLDFLFNEYNPYCKPIYYVTTKFFKKEIIDEYEIFFREDVSLGEDQIFISDYLKHITSSYYTSEPGRVTFRWDNSSTNYRLGTMRRSPEEYVFIQKENYKALMSLYEITSNIYVQKYAIYYLIDRPITRLLFKYCYFKKSYRHETIEELFKNQLLPIYRNLENYEDCIKSKYVEKTFHKILAGDFNSAWFIVQVVRFCSSIKQSIKLFLVRLLRFYRGVCENRR